MGHAKGPFRSIGLPLEQPQRRVALIVGEYRLFVVVIIIMENDNNNNNTGGSRAEVQTRIYPIDPFLPSHT